MAQNDIIALNDGNGDEVFSLDADGDIQHRRLVIASVSAADATGGATTTACTVQLNKCDEATAIDAAAQALIVITDAEYAPLQSLNANVTFSGATAGTIVNSGSGWCLFETTAAGAFGCVLTNSSDETVYAAVRTADTGCSDPTDGVLVVASNSDSIEWAS